MTTQRVDPSRLPRMDRLELAKYRALEFLAEDSDRDVAVNVGSMNTLLVLGLGYCVARGWAAYRGTTGDQMYFRIKPEGRQALEGFGNDG